MFIFFNKWWVWLSIIIFGIDDISSTYADKWKYQYQFKAKDSDITPYPLYLGNIAKYFRVDNIKTGLNKYVHNFAVEYSNTFDIINIAHIQKQYKYYITILSYIHIKEFLY